MPEAGRVGGGRARGIRLAAPGGGTRPLGDRVKESLFGTLAAVLPDARFLDLFAGSGAAGIEALSRGAASADLVERDATAVAAIQENLRRTGLAAGARIHRSEVLRFLREEAAAGAPYHLVFLDPPYEDPAMLAALELLAGGRLLAPEAIVVAKHFWRDPLPETIGALRRTRTRRFGETALTFFVSTPGEAAG